MKEYPEMSHRMLESVAAAGFMVRWFPSNCVEKMKILKNKTLVAITPATGQEHVIRYRPVHWCQVVGDKELVPAGSLFRKEA